MDKIIKAILIFLGGLITGVGVIVGAILKNETACKYAAWFVYDAIFEPKPCERRTRGFYRQYYQRGDNDEETH
jgi:hypothetical protein